MKFLVNGITDIGIKKKNNQDSYCYKVIESTYGEIFFAVLCDGMGGLKKGEVASATVVKHFSDWAEIKLKEILSKDDFSDYIIRKEFGNIIKSENKKILMYGKNQGVAIGTTVTVLLIINNKYYVANVGDTRAYEINKNNDIRLITHDHSLVQKEVDNGIITENQAREDSRRNILLQCIGATRNVNEDIFIGNVEKNTVFVLATDGFRNKITNQELINAYKPENIMDAQTIKQVSNNIIKIVKSRMEMDNISVIAVKCC